MTANTAANNLSIRRAVPEDAPVILSFIQALADYEKEPDAVEVDAPTLQAQLAQDRPPFECLLAERDGRAVGFALFFTSYSTWRGRPGIYLEDLFVPEAERGQGVGLALMRAVAGEAVRRGCARMEWAVLNWNKPSIDFYDALGATPMSEWTTYRLTDAPLAKLGAQDPRQ